MGPVDTIDQGTPLPVDTAPVGAGFLNTFFMDTLGTAYRAATGKTDPWTENELAAQAAGEPVAVQTGTSDQAAQQSYLDTENAVANEATYSQAAGDWMSATFNDDGSGCSLITNPAGCYPSWTPYALIGVGILIVLYILGPYVGLLEERR